jgi:intracellular sulfur oxidation DsrE/DsrF family protein
VGLVLALTSGCAVSTFTSTSGSGERPVSGASVAVGAGTSAEEPLSEDKPFAEAHVIMQISQSEPSRFRLALDIANNLAKHYGGQDMVDVELIGFGDGAAFLLDNNNVHHARIESLMEHGVRFYICGNTLDTMERRAGKRPSVLPGITTVQTGVAFMLEEIQRGYVHVQP